MASIRNVINEEFIQDIINIFIGLINVMFVLMRKFCHMEANFSIRRY